LVEWEFGVVVLGVFIGHVIEQWYVPGDTLNVIGKPEPCKYLIDDNE
jgi:hypothetical protein